MAMEEEAYIPEEWSEAAATIASASASGGITAFICGPKNSGKSTFSRHLLQLLLPRYFLLFLLGGFIYLIHAPAVRLNLPLLDVSHLLYSTVKPLVHNL
ncbi:putative P-loop containing nucleoside triphosphate hydrolase [Helianthus anomalus]